MLWPVRREVRRFLFLRYNRKARYETFLLTNIHMIMKELIDILMSEDRSFEGLPAWVWLIAAPAALVIMCMIGGTLS